MKYVVGEAILNVRHGGVVSLLAMLIVALTTALFSSLYLVRNVVAIEVERFEESPSVVAFPADSLSDDEVKALDGRVRAIEGVQRTIIVWKDEALKRSRDLFGEQSDALLRGFEGENPLPVSIEVYSRERFRDADAVSLLAKQLKTLAGVENVLFESESLILMERVKRAVFLLGGLIVLISVVVISFSIMLTVYARREELAILQLVGATYGFIRLPLLLQGCFEGFLGSGLGLLILYALFRYLGPTVGLNEFLTVIQMGVVVIGATLVGMFGGLVPLRRRIRAMG